MANQLHLAILKQGKVAWNEWRKQHQDIHPDLSEANLREADLRGIDFTEANLKRAHLENANLMESLLERAYLREAHLDGAILDTAHLEGARLYRADLTGANLRYAYLDRTCNLDSIDLDEAKVADVRWGDVNLALVAWDRVKILGDELEANNQTIPKRNDPDKENKKNDWLWAYRKAIRANRQVATILRDQGWDEVAEKLDYRAQVLQRKLIYRQGRWRKTGLRIHTKPSRWWSIRRVVSSRFSLLLDWIAGYGYKPWRWLCLYLLNIIVFAIFHYSVEKPLLSAFSVNLQNFHAWLDAFFRSVLALHGRSFTVSSDPHSGINTVEAFVGLVIEAILIAIITKRILGKSGGGD
jgi:hypothetical protein